MNERKKEARGQIINYVPNENGRKMLLMFIWRRHGRPWQPDLN